MVRNREGSDAAGGLPPGSVVACLDEEGKLVPELPLAGPGRNNMLPGQLAPILPRTAWEAEVVCCGGDQRTETQLFGLMRPVVG